MYEFNIVPWSQAPPTRPGLYLVMTQNDDVIVASVYPEKGNLFVSFGMSCLSSIPIEKTEGHVKLWSARISWAEIFV